MKGNGLFLAAHISLSLKPSFLIYRIWNIIMVELEFSKVIVRSTRTQQGRFRMKDFGRQYNREQDNRTLIDVHSPQKFRHTHTHKRVFEEIKYENISNHF